MELIFSMETSEWVQCDMQCKREMDRVGTKHVTHVHGSCSECPDVVCRRSEPRLVQSLRHRRFVVCMIGIRILPSQLSMGSGSPSKRI